MWCEKFLQTPSAQSEQDCYRFYQFCKASLEDWLRAEATAEGFTTKDVFDCAEEPGDRVRLLSERLDAGESIFGLRIRRGLYGTVVTGIRKENDTLAIQALGMSPVISRFSPFHSACAGYSAYLVSDMFRGLQPPVSSIYLYRPDLSGTPGFDLATICLPGSADLENGSNILSAMKALAASPLEAPAEGNVYPALDYAGLTDGQIVRAGTLARSVSSKWRDLASVWAPRQGNDELAELDTRQKAACKGHELVCRPYARGQDIIAYACAHLPVDASVNADEGSWFGPTAVLECFGWRDGQGKLQVRTLDFSDVVRNTAGVAGIQTELGALSATKYRYVAADWASYTAGSVTKPKAVLGEVAELADSGRYYHPAAQMGSGDVYEMIRLLGGAAPEPQEPLGGVGLLLLAKGLAEHAQLGDLLLAKYKEEKSRLEVLCLAVLELNDLVEARAWIAQDLAPKRCYSRGTETWAAYDSAEVARAMKIKLNPQVEDRLEKALEGRFLATLPVP